MALDTRRRIRRRDEPEANISNKTLPGFAVMGVGLLIIIVGAILIAVLGSPGSDFDMSTEPEKIVGVTVIGVGAVVIIIGIGVSIWLKTKKPDPQYHNREQHQPTDYPMENGYGRPSTVSNAYHMNYADNGYPVYGPPAPLRKS